MNVVCGARQFDFYANKWCMIVAAHDKFKALKYVGAQFPSF